MCASVRVEGVCVSVCKCESGGHVYVRVCECVQVLEWRACKRGSVYVGETEPFTLTHR